jgi:2-polyprenyl-3-methyl-5-hydroxy-6-metoxy-1,4-benzoquinol methylase
MTTNTKKTDCICCGSTDLKEVINLNDQPLANSYHDNNSELDIYPLRLNLCKNCYHLQLSHIVNPDLMFKDYLYVSGTTKTLCDYFDWFADFVTSKNKVGNVLDIACNDGSQLNSFKRLGWQTYGVDPAENLYGISSENHNVVCDYFLGRNQFSTKFDVVTAQNVFAHNENALKFLNDCSDVLDDDGTLYIQTSQSEIVNSNQFDTIYHEHISFFNINSMNELSKRSKLHLVDVIKTPVHGISYVFVFKKTTTDVEKRWVDNLIDVEKERGLCKLTTYDYYADNIRKIRTNFNEQIDKHKSDGYTIIGYGAAAKGMTFLNFAGCDQIDTIIDDNPLKQGLYTPGSNIQINSIEYVRDLPTDAKVLFVPLAWNFYNEIRDRIKRVRYNTNDVFLKYFPSVVTEG